MQRGAGRTILHVLAIWAGIYLLSRLLDVLPGWVGTLLFLGVLLAVVYYIARAFKRGNKAWQDLTKPERGKIIEGEIVKDTKKVK